ncbi:hypothetical protein HYH02_007748 [Chlamydomonas schloesseri]|uniref:FAS1 domain-containing protein n=1 Tax=Chlamydomonas schloesseri TaxID=2026947 RepID=A0A835WHD0_9CHLO|nr:hypothetical protein HYH02_007748 [Chlamydomonas schloesseri]|eukprot:KAG2447422.1 hypothetical protein HYH02_007748 [Chlamydomonas schloesseri]
MCLAVVCGAASSAADRLSNRGLDNKLAASDNEDDGLGERRIAQEGTTKSKLPPGSFDFPPEGAPPSEEQRAPLPPAPRIIMARPSPSPPVADSSPQPAPEPSTGDNGTQPSPSPSTTPAPSYPPTPSYGVPPPCGPGAYGYGGDAAAYGSYGYGSYGCHTPMSPPPYGGYYGSSPPPPYGGYGGYGGYSGYFPSPAVQPSPAPTPSPEPSHAGGGSSPPQEAVPSPSPSPASGAGPSPSPSPASGAGPSSAAVASPSPSPGPEEDENAPSPPPERWSTIWHYLDDVVVPDMWPFLVAAMDPLQKAFLQDERARFTLFIPLYEAMLKDQLILSIFANPADPRNAMRLNRLMAYHQVLNTTLYPQDLQDGLTVTNMFGETLTITQMLTDDNNDFYVNGVSIARWQVGGRGIVFWLNGVIHEPVAPSPPVAGPNRFGTLSEALASLPQCSIMSGVFEAVTADPTYGPLVSALLANPFTLFTPTDTAFAAYLGAMGLAPGDLLSLDAIRVAAIIAPHLVATGDAFLPTARLPPGAAVVTGLPPMLPSATLVVLQEPGEGGLPVLAYADGSAPPLHLLVADVFVRAEGDPTEAVVHVVDAVVAAPSPGGGARRRLRNRRTLSSS